MRESERGKAQAKEIKALLEKVKSRSAAPKRVIRFPRSRPVLLGLGKQVALYFMFLVMFGVVVLIAFAIGRAWDVSPSQNGVGLDTSRPSLVLSPQIIQVTAATPPDFCLGEPVASRSPLSLYPLFVIGKALYPYLPPGNPQANQTTTPLRPDKYYTAFSYLSNPTDKTQTAPKPPDGCEYLVLELDLGSRVSTYWLADIFRALDRSYLLGSDSEGEKTYSLGARFDEMITQPDGIAARIALLYAVPREVKRPVWYFPPALAGVRLYGYLPAPVLTIKN